MLRANAPNVLKSIRFKLSLLKSEPIQVLTLLLFAVKYAIKKPQLTYKLGLFSFIRRLIINYLFRYQVVLLITLHHGTH